jgi:hypothetical protein
VSASVRWEGLEEWKAALRQLTDEASGIVFDAANGAADTIVAGYPSRTGDLKHHVAVTVLASGPFGVRVQVKNASKHALEFEVGTEARHYITVNGKTHLTGKMPPNPLFSQTIKRARRAMYEGPLKALLVRKGLLVSGEA